MQNRETGSGNLAEAGFRGDGESFSASPLFQYTFAAVAAAAQPPALRRILVDALRRHARMAFVMLEDYGDRCLAAGDPREARDAYRRAVLMKPSLPAALSRLLAMARAVGRRPSRRWSSARRILDAARPAMLSEAVRATAEDWFGPVGHYEALRTIGRALRPRVYLEIGVDEGGSLAVAHPGARRIAVDPFPRLDPADRRGLELFETTSDAFFRGIEHRLPGLRVDLAFIDGLHEARQLLRDFRETERRCRRDATIVLHDVLPLHRVSAEPERRLNFWVGDCWRVLCLLAEIRPDLDIAIVRAAPSGLAVIRRLDPGDRRLFDAEQRLYDRLAAFDLGRDFVPAVLRLPWLEPDRPSLEGLLTGALKPSRGWARFRATATEIHAVRASRDLAPAGDPEDIRRLIQVLDPAAARHRRMPG